MSGQVQRQVVVVKVATSSKSSIHHTVITPIFEKCWQKCMDYPPYYLYTFVDSKTESTEHPLIPAETNSS